MIDHEEAVDYYRVASSSMYWDIHRILVATGTKRQPFRGEAISRQLSESGPNTARADRSPGCRTAQ